MDRTFNYAGTSINEKGIKTFRFANGKVNLRANMLKHCGHTSIDLRPTPRPMTQAQAISWLTQQGVTGAVLMTRSKDKTRKSAAQIEGEAMAATAMKRRATRAANKQAAGKQVEAPKAKRGRTAKSASA